MMTFKTFSMLLPILSFICSASAIKVEFNNNNDVKFEDGSELEIRHVNAFLNSKEGRLFLRDVIIMCDLLDDDLKKHIFEQGHLGVLTGKSITENQNPTKELNVSIETYGMINVPRVYTDMARSVFTLTGENKWKDIDEKKTLEGNAGLLLHDIRDAIINLRFDIISCNPTNQNDSVEIILSFKKDPQISSKYYAIYQNEYEDCVNRQKNPHKDFTVCMYLNLSQQDLRAPKYFKIGSIFPMKDHYEYEPYYPSYSCALL